MKNLRGGIRMKFIIIFGPQAVGKMTVGHELEKITGIKLLHNHQTLELLEPYFGFTPKTFELSNFFRNQIFKAVAESNLNGLIFTYVWAFDLKEDWKYINEICQIFEEKNAEVYFVELEADLEVRLIRNKTPFRLEQKPSKRNTVWSEHELKDTMENHRLNSNQGEITHENYLRINNTHLHPMEVATMINEKFKFK